jgi:hypothetical protein
MKTATLDRVIHKELRKHPFAVFLTGPEFSPRSGNKIIKGIVNTIRKYSHSQISAEFRKTGDRITFAKVTSADNSMTAKILYQHSYAPIDFHMMKDMVPAEIVLDIHYNPAVNKAYDGLARKL